MRYHPRLKKKRKGGKGEGEDDSEMNEDSQDQNDVLRKEKEDTRNLDKITFKVSNEDVKDTLPQSIENKASNIRALLNDQQEENNKKF